MVWWEEIARNTTERSLCSQHATLLEWMLCPGCRETSREALNRKNVSVASQVQRVWQCDLFFYFPCCNEAWTDLGKYLQGSEAKQVDGLYELLNVKSHQKCISCLLSITSKILVKIVRHAKAFGTDHSFIHTPLSHKQHLWIIRDDIIAIIVETRLNLTGLKTETRDNVTMFISWQLADIF